MNIDYNVSIKGYNTFGIDEIAEKFVVLQATNELRALSETEERKIIGSGSNILCTQSISALLIANRLKGIEQIKEDEHSCLV
jgi:UDP-N-acetylmuramate dehydrogenase